MCILYFCNPSSPTPPPSNSSSKDTLKTRIRIQFTICQPDFQLQLIFSTPSREPRDDELVSPQKRNPKPADEIEELPKDNSCRTARPGEDSFSHVDAYHLGGFRGYVYRKLLRANSKLAVWKWTDWMRSRLDSTRHSGLGTWIVHYTLQVLHPSRKMRSWDKETKWPIKLSVSLN